MQLFTTAVGKRYEQAVDKALRARQDGRVKRIGQTFTITLISRSTRRATHLSGVIHPMTAKTLQRSHAREARRKQLSKLFTTAVGNRLAQAVGK